LFRFCHLVALEAFVTFYPKVPTVKKLPDDGSSKNPLIIQPICSEWCSGNIASAVFQGSRRFHSYVLEIFFAAVPLIDENHFKGLIRRDIKEYSRKYDFNPLPIPEILTW
jgi:hypothetical protein